VIPEAISLRFWIFLIATLPVFARIARSYGTSISVLYGMNTLGAALGALLIAFVWIRTLGVERTCWAVACVNLAVFAGTGSAVAPESSHGARPQRSAPPSHLWPMVARHWLRNPALRSPGSLPRAAFQSVTESFAIMLVAVLVRRSRRLVPTATPGRRPAAARAGGHRSACRRHIERTDLIALCPSATAGCCCAGRGCVPP
jgi:hypothetical protein